MGRQPHDANDSETPADATPIEPREDAPARAATRRQFVVGISGVLVGAAACDDGAGEGDGTGGSGASGGSAGTSGAPGASGGTSGSGGSAGSGGSGAKGGSTSSGGSAGATGANAGTTSSGGSAGASGGETARGGSAGANGGNASAGGPSVSGGAPAAGGAAPGGAGSGGTSAGGRKSASDRVILGDTGIEVSRLAMGSGTVGSGGRSQQTRLGVAEFSDLLVYGFEQGITFFETADAYGSHPHVAEAIRQVGRENVVVLTKTTSENAARVEADLARFRTELGIDMIDIVLLHLKTSDNWTSQCEGAMEALAKAKQSGAIRAHGVSCHSLEALRLAAQTPWVDVDLARVNPAGVVMDAEPGTVIDVLREMKTARKGVIGMKILGEGQLANQLDMAIRHAVNLETIDAFTIGFTSRAQLDEIIEKIATV
jgi:aryl-alcohol dehydrogenase-like predicted oxidoreductase